VRLADRQLGIDDTGADRRQHLAQLGLRPDGTEHAGACPGHGDRLVPEHIGRDRSRRPIERVLELSRDRGVVLGRRDHQGVGAGDRRAQLRDGRRRRGDVVVLVVRRDILQTVPELELDARRQQIGGGPQELAVVGVAAEAAGYAEDLHLWTRALSYSLTK
jgi:hypothetical protein